MGSTSKAVGRFVLTWFPFSVMATLYSSLYPVFFVHSTFLGAVLWLAAVGVGIHAAARGVPRVDRSYKLLVAVLPSWYVLARVRMYGPQPEFPSLLTFYAFWTAMAGVSFGTAYLVVYRLRLLDRDGPLGRRLGLA